MTSWDGQYGIIKIYKFMDKDGNVYTWKTSKLVDDIFVEMSIIGTVKAHTEFRGIKQTEITRCRVTVVK